MRSRRSAHSPAFSQMPDTDTISKMGAVTYSQTAVCYDFQNDRYSEIRFPDDFLVCPKGDELYPNDKNFYSKISGMARKNQERLVADFICAIVLEQLREYPKDKLLFVVKDAFETEKFVGRLGYLGLPLDRITIYFISSDLKDFLTHYLAPYSEERVSDLSLLRGETNRLLGPFPEDEEITMLRTFFWAFSNPEIYPLRINLFSQFMDRARLDLECERMRGFFSSDGWTEATKVDGGRGREWTRLPKVLKRCEDYIQSRLLPQIAVEQE